MTPKGKVVPQSDPGEVRRPPADPENKLANMQLTYAWEWWKFHAKQRTDMFNYFLVITGILANAYVQLLKESSNALPEIKIALGSLGMLTSFGFFLLDLRNRNQLSQANSILAALEDQVPFQYGRHLARKEDLSKFSLIQHRFVFRALEALIALGWLLSIVRTLTG